MSTQATEQPFRVLAVGDKGSGKTSLLLRTLGEKPETFTAIPDAIEQCDTAGQSMYRTLPANVYRACHAWIIHVSPEKLSRLQDLTDEESFDGTKMWMAEIKMYTHEDVVKVLVGNKADDEAGRKVSKEAAQHIASEMEIDYVETSANTDKNVDELLQLLIQKMRAKRDAFPTKPQEKQSSPQLRQFKTKKSKGKGKDKEKDKECVIA
eukprot:m51a1_g9171 putative ras-related protein rabd2a-like (208) ;mRNA; r:31570-32566